MLDISPTPWRAIPPVDPGECWQVEGPSGLLIADCWQPTSRADAAIMAAAPVMLDTLQLVKDTLNRLTWDRRTLAALSDPFAVNLLIKNIQHAIDAATIES